MVNAVIVENDALFIKYFNSLVKQIAKEMNIEFHLDCLIAPVNLEKVTKDYDLYFLILNCMVCIWTDYI